MRLMNSLILSAGLLCTFPSGLVTGDVSVNEILTNVSGTYRGLRSYQLVAEISEDVASVGEAHSLDGSRTWSNFSSIHELSC